MAGRDQISEVARVPACQGAVQIHVEVVANLELTGGGQRQEQDPSQHTTRPLNTTAHWSPLLIRYKDFDLGVLPQLLVQGGAHLVGLLVLAVPSATGLSRPRTSILPAGMCLFSRTMV